MKKWRLQRVKRDDLKKMLGNGLIASIALRLHGNTWRRPTGLMPLAAKKEIIG
jgi:hypothetical protein